jgi:tetratricopeptide (TPR) repeat protein
MLYRIPCYADLRLWRLCCFACCFSFFCLIGRAQVLPDSPEYNVMSEIARLKGKVLQNPNNAKVWFQLGRKYELRKEWGEAVHAYENAIRNKVEYGEAWQWLGWAYLRGHNEDEALKVFDELTALPSHAADGHFGIGWIRYAQGQYGKALAAYQKALQARPNFACAHYEIARAYLALSDPAAAQAQVEKLTKLDPALATYLGNELKRAARKPAAPVVADEIVGSKPYLLLYEKTKLPPAVKAYGLSGEVKLSVLVKEDGSASDIRPLSELPFGLTQIAIEAVEKFQFQPAIKLGKPIASKMVFTYMFWFD